MCQMDSHTEQQILFNPEKSSQRGDEGFVSCLPSKADKPLAAPSPSESGKKKRVQRSAKLKQCKMDARREQWLAQVSGKVVKPDSCASSRSSSQDDREEKELLLHSSPGELDMGTLNDKETTEESHIKRSVGSTPANEIGHTWSEGRFCNQGGMFLNGTNHTPLSHQHSSVCSFSGPAKQLDDREAERKSGQARRLDAPGMWSSSDTSSSQSNSSQVSSSSDDENEVEDWEAVADALHVQATIEDAKPPTSTDQYLSLNRPVDSKSLLSSDKCILKPESKYRPGNCGSRTRADAGRAWRPDDVSRPPTLPRLSKQHSFPLQSGPSLWAASHGSVWGMPPPPSHCPICTEELDTTDSSFVPCSCGFRLCLFCHHRILIGDGRCPGCRKSYNSEAALKLSRTSSVRPRV